MGTDSFTYRVFGADALVSISTVNFTINNANNDTPTNIKLTNSNINENSPNNTIIGQISVSDPDPNDTHTLTLIDDAGGRFKLVGTQLQVANSSLLDYETNTSHNITIKATDAGNLSLQKDLTINLINVNKAPTNIQVSKNTIEENSLNGTVIGTLNTTDPDANNTFTYSLVDNAGDRFAINGNQLIVADGSKLDYETNQKHTITIRTQDQGGLTYDKSFDINLIDVADSSVIAFSQANYSVKEDGTPIIEITLTRNINTQGEVSVTVTPSNGTATAPYDYNNAPITVTFLDGETSKKIAIPIVKDTAYEGNETLNLTLSNPTNGATIGTQKTATLTIVDTPITYYLTTPTTWTDAQAQAQAMGGNLVTINDAAENQFLVNAFGGNESFWIGFTDAGQEGNWQWINGEPVIYTNWNPGEPNNYKNEDYGAMNWWIGGWNDFPNYTSANDSNVPSAIRGIVEVLNGTSTISVSDTTINESQNQATVTVQLTGISHQAFTVDYSTNDGTAKAVQDYTTVSGKLTFNAGESVKTITIPINNDSNYEGNETFTLNLYNPTGGAVLGQSNATITIIDNDVPQPGTLAFSNAQFSVNEDGTPIVAVKINRTNGTDGQVSATINLNNNTATAPNDYNNNPITVIFANGETSKTITIPIVYDIQFEGNETLNLTLTNATSGATIGTQDKATLTIVDNEINQGITLDEGQTNLIDNTVLKAVETNKLPTDIIYTLTDLPDNGQLILNNPVGKALSFDGVNDYIALGNPSSLQITGNQTLELWIKPTHFNYRQNPFNKAWGGEGTLTLEGNVSWAANGTVNYYYGVTGTDWGSGGINYQGFNTNQSLNINQWSHLAVVRDFNNQKLSWYINGVKVNETYTIFNSATPSNNPIYIGTGYTNYFNGLIDEVQIWNKARTQAEIQADMNRQLTGNETGLVGYWNFNEGSGNIVTDLTNNHNNGTVYGATWTTGIVPTSNTLKLGDTFTQADLDNGLLTYQHNGSETTSDNFKFTVTDGTITSSETAFNITVNNVNEAPTAIQLSNTNIQENSPNGTVIGTLTTTDPDLGDTHTYELINNADGRFAINNNQLIVADGTKLDYETNANYPIVIRSKDSGGLSYDKSFIINLIDVPEPGTLAFSNAQFSVNEDGTPVNQIKIIRTGGSQGEVSTTIDLTNGTATSEDYDKTSIPVTFANGETEKFVTVPITNDTFVENPETINLTLTNPTNGATLGSQNTATLTILDDDAQLNFNAANYTVSEDGTAVTDIIITRTGRATGTVGATITFANGTAKGCACGLHLTTSDFLSSPITVILGENEISKIIPVQLAGSQGSNFIPIINDTQVESNETFTINLTNPTGGATIGNQNSATVTILDDDIQLAFSAPNFAIREDGTAIAAVTVNRIGRLTGVVGATINLDGGSATYPDDYIQTSLNIFFADGENSKTVNIPVRNDITSEPDETVNLTLVNPTGGATLGNQNIATLTIVDNGLTPSLSLAIDKDIIAENAGNNAATATITRSIVTDEDLIVTLASNDTSEITVPNQVIIPANQASATFTLNAVDDNITDGIQTVTITATANGFSQGIDTINVADINVPDLKIVNLSASTPLLTGKQGSFTYRVVNQGLSDASGTWTDKVYLSTDTTLETNKDIFLDNYQFSGTIPTGLFYERNLPFFIPKTPGKYYLIAQTDTANTINEGIGLGENNNTSITSINITPAYRATVSTDTEIGVTGNKVILQGKAFSNSDNSAVPYEFVTIAIKYNGTVRELTAFTDKNGNFVKDFQPLPGEGGQYQINAYFSGYSSEDTIAEDSFKLLGMRFNTGGAYYQINANSPFNATATLQNLTDIPITGITYTVAGAPQDWNIQVNAPDTLAGNTNLPISYTITAPNNSPITQDTFNINLTSAEGVSTTLPVTINLRRIVPHLVANTNLLSNGMLRGKQTPIEFEVTNNGGIATGEVKVILPNAPWLKLASPVTLSSLNPGESSKVTLLLAPDTNLPLTVYNGNLVLDVVGNDGDLSLPFSFRAVSDAVGSLQISVVDELTFFTESAPKLKDATIILRDYITGNEVRRITTDVTGMVSWDNLTEGYYQLEVQAKNHDSYTQTIQIKAGETEDIESFLSRQTVKYVWRVVPTEIEDKYSITIESVFETHVPALDAGGSGSIPNPIPTVTIDPPLIDLINLQVVGQMMQVDMTVTNHGLIAANDVRLNFGEHPFYKIEPLIENIGTLGAKSSMTIPVTITRIGDFENPQSNELRTLAAAASQSNVPCGIEFYLLWDYICGSDRGEPRKIQKANYVTLANVEGNCPQGNGNSGQDFPIPPRIPSISNSEWLTDFVEGVKLIPIIVGQPSNSENCNPCLYEVSEKFFNCYKDLVLSLIPFSWVFGGQLVSCTSSVVSFLEGMKDGFGKTDALNLIGFINDCLIKGSSAISIAATIIKCGLEIGEATKVCQFSENSTKTESLRFSLTTELNLQSLKTIQNLSNSNLQNQLLLFNQHLERLQTIVSAIIFPVNESVWFQDTDALNSSKYLSFFFSKTEEFTENGFKISDSEKDEILNLPLPLGVAGTDVNKLIERWNRTIDYWNAGIFNLADVPEGQNTDFIAIDVWKTNINAAIAAIEQSQAEGFTNIVDEIKYGYENFKTYLEGKNGGVCAQVKLQINQDAIMTRSAFLGTLEIDNSNDTNNLENITVTINIKDSQGNTVNNLFGITNPTLSNLTAVDGTGTLLANASGSAEWTFIPTGNAAPNEPTIYSIGGSLSYKENGNIITVPLLSTPVTVFPQAELYLDYFHQRDVFADDPFTVEIEPSVPFSLGILVKNQGKGTAKNLHISSAQPKIIDNEKGLLIDFNIIGTQIGNQSITPSLSVNFGNIEAGKTAVADWLFKSDLQGKFTDYKATFEHINDLGKPELSLIKEVKIHELSHQVNVDSDNLPDFLVNDIPDPNFYPDILYFSDGATAPVNVVTNATTNINNQQAQIIVNVNSGWTYLHLADPSNGSLEIAQVLRSDGTSIKLDNVWTTDRTFPATGRPIYENILHLLDYNANAGNSNYIIIYTSGGPTVTDIIDVTPDPRSTAVNAIAIDFSEPIQASTFDYTDLSLTLNNGTNLITNIVSIIPLSATRYQVTGLENLTNIDGDYQLTINANGIKDLDGKLGTGLLSETWVKTATGNADNTPPTVTDIRELQIDPRNIPVSSLDVTLSEAIDLSSFTWEDITLTRNSGSNLINNTVTITPVNDTTYRINGLSNLTQTEGTYTLTVNGNGIKDLSGNSGTGSASETWIMDVTPPNSPTNIKVSDRLVNPNIQNLINTTKPTVTGNLSETSLQVFIYDKTLNQSLGQATVTGNQFNSTVQLTSVGTRDLQIRFIDAAGNTTNIPLNLFVDVIQPSLIEFLNIPQNPVTIPIEFIDVRFSEIINLSTFDYQDISLTRNSSDNLITDAITVEYLSGTTYRIKGLTNLTTTTGNYQLTVNTNTLQDPAGNSGDTTKQTTFSIISVNQPPQLTINQNLTLDEGKTANITSNQLQVTDTDNTAAQITYTLTHLPDNGSLLLNSTALTLNNTFTQADIDNNKLIYTHNGSETTSDSFNFTVSDGTGGSLAATTFNITVNPVNDVPVVLNAIASQTTTEGQTFNYTFPENTFFDSDLNEVLTYTATLDNGNALPNWLSFNGATRTFNGIPTQDSAGLLNLIVTATDTAQAKVSNSFTLTILDSQPVDHPPTVANPINYVTVDEDAANTVIDLTNVFTDIDNDPTLIVKSVFTNDNPGLVTANIVNNQLTLDYQDNQSGTAQITIRGTSNGKFVDDTFLVTVNPVDDAPTILNPITDVNVDEDAANTVIDITNVFTDIDNDPTLIVKSVFVNDNPRLVTATIVDNQLILDYQDNQSGIANITIRGTSNGEFVEDTFTVTVASVNDLPTLQQEIANQTAIENQPFSFTIPANTFQDIDDDNLTYSLATATVLPNGITFNPTTRTFNGTPSDTASGIYNLTVIASDSAGEKANDSFSLNILNAVNGSSNSETINGTSGDDYINASGGNDTVNGGAGNDILDGGTGNDRLIGGIGNDTYIVDSSRDLVIENTGEGHDTVQSSVNYTLTVNIEDLTLTGNDNTNGTGNNLDNVITGNSGNNLLKGLDDNDTLLGNAGNDTLIGGKGNDILTGGDGSDSFLFGSGAIFNSSDFGVDSISDFIKGTDKIILSNTSFNALVSTPGNSLQAADFAAINEAANELALVGSSSAKIVYNLATGNLFYNQNSASNGLGNGALFANFNGIPQLSENDILIQA
ncbi:MAG: hypothetical protein GPI95_13180 [Microcystis aeruginosa LG13-11]|nr:hypothetical protein [Microcystis aeruginosa LG13-11]